MTRYIEKHEKWEMHTVGPGIRRANWKSRKMRNTHFRTWNMARKTEKGAKFRNVHCRTWNMARKLKIMENEKHPLDDMKNDEITEKREKWKMHTVGPWIWRENWKSRKMRNTDFRTWNMVRKTERGGKFRNVHYRTWNMARKLKIMENEKHLLDDFKNDEITEKREKWEMHTVGPGIWQENWKSPKMGITLVR
jgi:co-chaperonin GroES (HSP10)